MGILSLLPRRLRLRPRHLRTALTLVLDVLVPKRWSRVTFICKKSFGFAGNIRVATLAFAEEREYEVQLWCEAPLPPLTEQVLREAGVRLLHRFSLGNVLRLVSSGVLVVDHSARDAHIIRRSRRRALINLWHGVPIKRIELTIPGLDQARQKRMTRTDQLYDVLIASSERDAEAISTSFGVPRERVAVTGLPRYDLLFEELPPTSDLSECDHRIEQLLAGRRLVLFAPTFREHGCSPVEQVSPAEWSRLCACLRDKGAVLGIRLHPYDRARCPEQSPDIIDLGAAAFPETNLVLRHTSILVTDFSSLWVDYVLLQRPIAGFAKDASDYMTRERGCLYDLEEVFPGPFFTDIAELETWLACQLDDPNPIVEHEVQHQLFHTSLARPYAPRCTALIRSTSPANDEE